MTWALLNCSQSILMIGTVRAGGGGAGHDNNRKMIMMMSIKIMAMI